MDRAHGRRRWQWNPNHQRASQRETRRSRLSRVCVFIDATLLPDLAHRFPPHCSQFSSACAHSLSLSFSPLYDHNHFIHHPTCSCAVIADALFMPPDVVEHDAFPFPFLAMIRFATRLIDAGTRAGRSPCRTFCCPTTTVLRGGCLIRSSPTLGRGRWPRRARAVLLSLSLVASARLTAATQSWVTVLRPWCQVTVVIHGQTPLTLARCQVRLHPMCTKNTHACMHVRPC